MNTAQNNDITALRGELFASIKRLAGTTDPKEIERAKAIADTAQVIVNTAKVEVDFIKATGNPGGSGFIPLAAPSGKSGNEVITQRPGVTVTRHRLEG
jgi:hypothetical protein